jgi:hypothetical protein
MDYFTGIGLICNFCGNKILKSIKEVKQKCQEEELKDTNALKKPKQRCEVKEKKELLRNKKKLQQ